MSRYDKRHHHGRHRRDGGRARHHGCDAEQWAAGPSFRRRFATRDERITRLETYLGELRAEAEAVEEHIAELKSVGNS